MHHIYSFEYKISTILNFNPKMFNEGRILWEIEFSKLSYDEILWKGININPIKK